jgi:hypothetical protein
MTTFLGRAGWNLENEKLRNRQFLDKNEIFFLFEVFIYLNLLFIFKNFLTLI